MVGIKGRSGGKAVTLEAKQLKAAATAAREAKRAEAQAAAAADRNALGPPLTYGDLLKSEQVLGERTQNRRREVEVQRAEAELEEALLKLSISKGEVIPKEELDRAMVKFRDSWWREVQQVSGLVLPRLSDIPGEIRARVKSAIDAEVAAAAERVKASMA